MGVVIGILFLEETHAEKKYRHDPGLEAGKWLLSKVRGCTAAKQIRCEKVGDIPEVVSLLEDQSPPGYRTTEGSPQISTAIIADSHDTLGLDTRYIARRIKPAAKKAFTRQVVINIIGYGILA